MYTLAIFMYSKNSTIEKSWLGVYLVILLLVNNMLITLSSVFDVCKWKISFNKLPNIILETFK